MASSIITHTLVSLLLFTAAIAEASFLLPEIEILSLRRLRARTRPDYETEHKGRWELFVRNSGVSAMHMAITHNNKAIIFDATNFGPSGMQLPNGKCRVDPEPKKNNRLDCRAHAVELDYKNGNIRPLKVLTNTWCSSGAFGPDGTLVQAGGFGYGDRTVRYLGSCSTCDWGEFPTTLSVRRWYATQQILPNGGFIIIGGRRQFNYEYIPPPGESNPSTVPFPFLSQTSDRDAENNLYPFVYLIPDGNLFIFANNRSILLNPNNNKIVRELPPLEGGSRNYPASAASVLLPIDVSRKKFSADVLICGGAKHEAYGLANRTKGFLPALATCGRLTVTNPSAVWKIEVMPMPRVMADALLLPNGEVLIINGASKGTSGVGCAREPVLEPLLYRPKLSRDSRFQVLNPSTIPRMYHSSSAVLPDGSILVGGSNTQYRYVYENVMFPTELRVEKFYPHYTDRALEPYRPRIKDGTLVSTLKYGTTFTFQFKLADLQMKVADIQVTIYSPPFTTHGYSMNQRMLILRTLEVTRAGMLKWNINVKGPPSAALAPPGYYMLFVVNRGMPSEGVWVQIVS